MTPTVGKDENIDDIVEPKKLLFEIRSTPNWG